MKAFPNYHYAGGAYQGMDLRDYFACQAMLVMAWHKNEDAEDAKDCYVIADAMMKAREQ